MSTSKPVMGADKGTYAHYRKPEVVPVKTPRTAKTQPFDSVVNGTNAVAPAKDYSKS